MKQPLTEPEHYHSTATYSPMSSFQTAGWSFMNRVISALHSSLSTSTTSTPLSFRYLSPPTNVLFSPMTTLAILYIMHAPVHMSHGERVVYITAPAYAEAGSLPEFSRAAISACERFLVSSGQKGSSSQKHYLRAVSRCPVGLAYCVPDLVFCHLCVLGKLRSGLLLLRHLSLLRR